MQARGQFMKQSLQIAMLRDDFAHVEERFQLTAGMIESRGWSGFRRNNGGGVRHGTRIALRGGWLNLAGAP